MAYSNQAGFIRLVFETTSFFEMEAIPSIAAMKEVTTEALLIGLTNVSTSGDVKRRIILCLGRRGTLAQPAIPTLEELHRALPLTNQLSIPIRVALAAIGAGNADIIAGLRADSTRADEGVKFAVLTAIDEVGAGKWIADTFVEDISKLIDTRKREQASKAAIVLGQLGPRAIFAVSTLKAALDAFQNDLVLGIAYASIVPNEQKSVVRKVVAAYGEDPYLGRSDWVRGFWVGRSLLRGNLYDLVVSFIQVNSDDARVVIGACKLVEAMGLRGNSSKTRLQDVLANHTSPQARMAAASALGAVLFVNETDKLSEALVSEGDESVRKAIARSLRRIELEEEP